MTMQEGCEPPGYDWAALVPRLIHPIKVGIIEALWRIEEPLSAADLRQVFAGQVDLSLMAYHVQTLAEIGVTSKVGQRQSRGALQKFYRLS